ncbi:MAG: DUF922 domain-containing protein [Bauldia sp.]|nr:DUF922 domain-containing protein [Bauldia sp.]
MGIARQLGRAARLSISTGLAVSIASAAWAGVKTSTQYRSYYVSGSTARSLVSYMRSHPFRGDRGDAVANVRPDYRLSVATKASGGTCRVSAVTLNINFVMTLPRARNESAMASSTRGAWRSFVSFAKQHESTHRNIYVQCGNSFVAKAQRMTSSNCGALQASVRRALESEKRSCEAKQRAFDRRDYGRVKNLSLFRMGR